jgi:hypothetical protein
MSDHDEWLKKAETRVREEFPSLTDIDAARIVELAVDVYERERWVKLSQRIRTLWFNIREENNEREMWPDDQDAV